MYKSLEVKKDIYWVGALDYDIRTFDIIMRTEYGTSYNSYLVKGSEKTALFEIVKEQFFSEFLERLETVTTPESIDYIIVDHTEPDHSSALINLIKLCPKATVVGTRQALSFLKEILNSDFKQMAVKEGDTISLGDKTLQFIATPFLHWPDTMYTYIPENKTLITCDSFGCHYANEAVFNDKIDGDFIDAYHYYFDCIISPFKPYVKSALEKIKPLSVETICCGHGPVLRRDIQKYIDLYDEWSNPQEILNKVTIAYVSSYGYTAMLAEKIADGVKALGVSATIFDLTSANVESIIADIENSKGLLIGSPTLLSDTLPPVWNLLAHLNPVIHKGKIAGCFGSFGWSGEACNNITERFKQLKFKTPVEPYKIHLKPSENELNLAYEFGKNFASTL